LQALGRSTFVETEIVGRRSGKSREEEEKKRILRPFHFFSIMRSSSGK
jgi:hypothetical protein